MRWPASPNQLCDLVFSGARTVLISEPTEIMALDAHPRGCVLTSMMGVRYADEPAIWPLQQKNAIWWEGLGCGHKLVSVRGPGILQTGLPGRFV